MCTRAKKNYVAGDRARRENVPRHILFHKKGLEERAWEFACEGDRWHDLVRREMVVMANAERLPNVKETARLLPKPGTEIIPGILDQNEY